MSGEHPRWINEDMCNTFQKILSERILKLETETNFKAINNLHDLFIKLDTENILPDLENRIIKLERAIGLQGYFSENPPISYQQHELLVIDKIGEIIMEFRKFYQRERKYMGTWFDKKFNEFFKEMEEKHLK